jgi:hypothetical protein
MIEMVAIAVMAVIAVVAVMAVIAVMVAIAVMAAMPGTAATAGINGTGVITAAGATTERETDTTLQRLTATFRAKPKEATIEKAQRPMTVRKARTASLEGTGRANEKEIENGRGRGIVAKSGTGTVLRTARGHGREIGREIGLEIGLEIGRAREIGLGTRTVLGRDIGEIGPNPDRRWMLTLASDVFHSTRFTPASLGSMLHRDVEYQSTRCEISVITL